ncbi:phosphoribosylamine--glycine ligase [Planktosalinus lacus]|uniref:Phosphoribosylamine--glycine ligase n=1 Tax=Planktosalinus lacus TaxID=1526573 RepID=A0A8J2V743_9FLAO|nr:phosphoribosylamine--glycine ligase [Planktosalinus lacus]GGD80009.1 phosphoribosylamine--glycine ligase [Planktosalinus lacus]
MNILILGSGGREHAFAHQAAKSSQCSKLYVAPGNAGTSQIAENVNMDVNDFEVIKTFVLKNKVGMVIVGPEDPLVNGIVDFFASDTDLKDVMIIGPSEKGAKLEGSKEFAKEFMEEFKIPTASYKSFTKETLIKGLQYIENNVAPYVLKADGLAAGKGVVILETADEAKAELQRMLVDEKFGAASKTVVIEQFLKGIELSVFVLTDGKNYKILPTAKDYKRIGEGDTGLNTGGMGAISPVPFADEVLMEKIEERIVKPTIAGIQKRNMNYKGFVFIGLIKVGDEPYVIEYNVRMGDPETEVVLPRIKTDLVSLLESTFKQSLNKHTIDIDSRATTTVMLVSGGYPEAYEKGKEITGIEEVENAIIFHAGTTEKNGKVVTNGGRVLAITSLDTTWQKALKKSYQNAELINFDRKYFRRDIGFDLS